MLDPIVAHESTDYGWRGLTASGEVIKVRSDGGVPDGEITMNGQTVDRRANADANIGRYLAHHDRAVDLLRENKLADALAEFDAAVALASTARARFNRSLALLGLGRWREGFEGYEARLEFHPATPQMIAAERTGIPRWRGEDVRGKKLMLVHDAGFGDSLMMLRYVPMLAEMGAEVTLMMPPELERLAAQMAPLAHGAAPDFYCGLISLLHLLDQTPDVIPQGPYLAIDPALAMRWHREIKSPRRKVGIAWSVGRTVAGDYPRAIPLAELVPVLEGFRVDWHSLQQQGADEAARFGVIAHNFEDFADCAALAATMDEVVTIDTAAVHVAGAIGHRNTTVLLSHFASWRWLGNAFYPAMKVAQQIRPGDWASALAQL
jgi:hypothetical protein